MPIHLMTEVTSVLGILIKFAPNSFLLLFLLNILRYFVFFSLDASVEHYFANCTVDFVQEPTKTTKKVVDFV